MMFAKHAMAAGSFAAVDALATLGPTTTTLTKSP
jgi:hypothetical protein